MNDTSKLTYQIWEKNNKTKIQKKKKEKKTQYNNTYHSFTRERTKFKGIVHLKMTSLGAIQDVDEFVSSSKQFWRNLALHQLLTNKYSAVNGCRFYG